mgnify:CR=1 FL=1
MGTPEEGLNLQTGRTVNVGHVGHVGHVVSFVVSNIPL